MVIDCKHVWNNISGYLDGTLDPFCLAAGAEASGALRYLFCNSRFDPKHPDPHCGRACV